jgi:GTP-binding protein LepA
MEVQETERKTFRKAKKGKAKMRQFGSVDIPQEAFIEVLKINKNE